jgi:hypothetical protein
VFQERLAGSVRVPVVTSSLMLLPLLRAMISPLRRIGVVVANSTSFSDAQIRAAGVEPDESIAVAGMENCAAFADTILAPKSSANAGAALDADAIERGLISVCEDLVRREGGVGAILLECTNLVPYASAVGERLNLPVYSIHTAVSLLYHGLVPPRFPRHDPASRLARR